MFKKKDMAGGAEWFIDAGNPAELCFRVAGVDTECYSDEQLVALANDVVAAQRVIPEDIKLFQIAIKRRRAMLPSLLYTNSDNPVVAETQRAREAHLRKIGFSSLELFLTLYVGPPSSKGFESHAAKTQRRLQLLADTERMLHSNLQRVGLRRLNAEELFEMYGYLATLRDGRPPVETAGSVAEQIAVERIKWNDDGLKIGERYAKVFSLLTRPAKTRPNQLGDLLRLDVDMVVVMETQRQSVDQTKRAANSQETFRNLFRERIMTMVSYFGDAQALQAKPKSAASQAADVSIGLTGLAGIHADLEAGIGYTKTSLIGLVHSHDYSEVVDHMGQVHRAAVTSKCGTFQQEGIGALSAFCSFFPGACVAGRPTNVRRRWLREDHVADLSLVYAPYRGEAYSPTLEDESHALIGTRDGSELWYDAFTPNGLRGLLVFGEAGRGKSFWINFLIDQETKYGGFIYVFDVGGSFEHTIRKHGGTVVRFGLSGPRLNPFSLPNTDENRRFAFCLVMMLLRKGGAHVTPQQEAEIATRTAALFGMEPEVRRLKYLVLPQSIQAYLNKWIEGGVYGNIFDNVEDELQLSRIAVFDFEALGDNTQEQKDLMEPLLSWIRWRINAFTHDAANIGVPKLEVYEETHRHIEDEQMRGMILSTSKTARKHRGGIVISTQSPEDLKQYARVIRANCPDSLLLGGAFDRKLYAELLELNERQMDLIGSLAMGEGLLTRKNWSKVVRLDVDAESVWRYTTRAADKQRRNEAIARHGYRDAFKQLAATSE
jgi:type IV secretion system protein VirB4